MIDSEGFRPNVGIILMNEERQVFWGRRVGQDAWQFPQGGVQENESLEEALFRELHEEIGLEPHHVKILGRSKHWLRYRLPRRLVRNESRPVCIGQKQRWFLLKMVAEDEAVRLDHTPKPEFDHWRWVSYWFPLYQVITFKREVYRKALREFKPIVMSTQSRRCRLDPVDET
ncbi:MAG: RNA pyrophosphohydrolase [Gammaproteobacteria bacterium]